MAKGLRQLREEVIIPVILWSLWLKICSLEGLRIFVQSIVYQTIIRTLHCNNSNKLFDGLRA